MPACRSLALLVAGLGVACAHPHNEGPANRPVAAYPPAYAAAPAPVQATPPAPPPVAPPPRAVGSAWTMSGLWAANPNGVPLFWPFPQPGTKPAPAPTPAPNAQFPWVLPSTLPSTIPWQNLPLPPGWGPPKPAPPPAPAPKQQPQQQQQPSFPIPGWGMPLPPSGGDWPAAWAALEEQVLHETNARRARGAVCGTKTYPPAGPLAPNEALRKAARGHSKDMATRNYFEHTSPEGVGPGPRSRAAGYTGAFTGENIAAGDRSAAQVVDSWMSSPGHCYNIMDARYKALGVGYAENASSHYKRYFTQNFGP
jgi:uncharacterized protein YkwD